MKYSTTVRAVLGGLLVSILCACATARPPGEMIDIGGRSLHVIETAGEGPVVVLEAGGGAYSSFWNKLQDGIRDELGLRVISYDRAGLGWSELDAAPYRIQDRADDLDALLTALDVDGPIVLVATSYGGWVAQAFSSRYPERIDALVLVEPNSSYFFAQYPTKAENIAADGAKRPMRGFKRLGLK